jgi:hypothetical protein
MKLSLPSILLLSLIAISKGQSAGPGPVSASDAAPAEATVEVTTDDAPDGDAGKECAADDCGAAAASSIEDTTESTAEDVSPEEEDANCPSRPHVIRCAAKYLDTNQNGVLERSELESVMKTVPWLLRGELFFVSFFGFCSLKAFMNNNFYSQLFIQHLFKGYSTSLAQ